MECLFCKIVSGQAPAKIIYRDDQVLAFNDIHPQAPHHKLIIPLKHLSTLNDIATADKDLIGHMLYVAKNLAYESGIAETGYRLAFNCNADGGQIIFHLHLHLLGGRPLSWPPG